MQQWIRLQNTYSYERRPRIKGSKGLKADELKAAKD